jgi:hypothetical protein
VLARDRERGDRLRANARFPARHGAATLAHLVGHVFIMGRAFKILSDFDGVFTDQGVEADENYRHVLHECVRLVGGNPARVEAEIERIRGEVLSTPAAWGWAPDGNRISAYVDEDPLCLSSAVCLFLSRTDEPLVREIRAAVEGEFDSLAVFSEHCFRAAVASYRERHPPCLVPDIAAQLERVLATGAEVVVVSNSSSEKIGAWLGSAGIDAGEGPGHRVRLRGSAGKQFLGDTDASIRVADRDVRIDRPRYRAAIVEEAPNLVIGDVFSLDLALPHVMRGEGHPSAPARIVLRRHPHTPAWVLGDRAHGAIDHVVDRFGDIAELVTR